MVFSSHIFLYYFLPIALAVYYILPRRGRHLGLTLFSYFFYGWANPIFVVLLLISTAIDYACGLVIAERWGARWNEPMKALTRGGSRTTGQRRAVTLSIISNLSILGFFKYFNFGAENYSTIIGMLGLEGLDFDTALRVTLPLGISFYTFQSMSYSIDVYRGDAKALRNPIDFACYVSMFPQLVAGPIIRYAEVADQLENRTLTAQKFARGVAFLCMGMAKKVLLANPCGKIADMAFDAGSLEVVDSWVGAVAYSFQIYFDFSGYSDMAIGLGLMLGFVFPKNFDSPYIAQSITEFWRRWHISLSTWLRDYLYLPLGGNRKGPRRTYVNLAIVMLMGGLWHGAAWNFVVWGGIHGAWLAFERAQGKDAFYRRMPKVAKIALTYLIVLVGWVFFRSANVTDAVQYLGFMVGLGDVSAAAGLVGGIIYQPYYLGSLAVAAGIVWGAPQTWDWTRRLTPARAATCIALFWLSMLMLNVQAFNPFIYFIF